jgi:hypothetical protein
VAIAITLRATAPGQLDPMMDWVHDAYFEHEDLEYDAVEGVVTVEFAQERGPHEQLPGSELLRRTWRYRELRVPFLRCRLSIRCVTGVEKDESRFDQPGMLLGIEFDGGHVKLAAVTGPAVSMAVTGLDVELNVTDEVMSWVRRREGRWTFIESDRLIDDAAD